MKESDIKPLCNTVIIKPEREVKSSILEIPDNPRDSSTDGYVVAFGPTAWLEAELGGKPQVFAGDHVIYAKYGGKLIHLEIDGKKSEYIVINDRDVLCKIP